MRAISRNQNITWTLLTDECKQPSFAQHAHFLPKKNKKKKNFGFLMRLRIESQWRFHQAIHMLRAPRWPNEEILRLLSSSKWAQHKELSVKSWMFSKGPLPKTSGLSTPFKATLPITFTQTVQTETTEMWKKKRPSSFLWQMSTVRVQRFHTSLKIVTIWASFTSNDAACFEKVKAKKYEWRRTGDIISRRGLRSGQ